MVRDGTENKDMHARYSSLTGTPSIRKLLQNKQPNIQVTCPTYESLAEKHC